MALRGAAPEMSHIEDAETIATFVIHGAEAEHGLRALVGARPSPLPEAPPAGFPGIARLATTGVRGVPDEARRALLGIYAGTHRADLFDRALEAREVVALQARGRRCVSLLVAGDPSLGPYASPLGFCAHDLGHLAAFFDPRHVRGQRGFFFCLDRALDAGLGGLLGDHDPRFEHDVLAVGADTNGSCVFAFASLVMKLKMAVRRAEGRRTGALRDRGPLTADEEAAFAPELRRFLRALGMPERLDADAALVGTRRDHREAARKVLAFFEDLAP